MNFKEYKEKAFKENPELYEEYKELEPEYELIKQYLEQLRASSEKGC